MPTDPINSGDTAWVIVSAALVMLMTPGLAFFYGGLVREKNVLGTIMHSFVVIGIVSVLWVVVGYSLAFGPDHWGLIGGFDWSFLRHVGQAPNPDYSSTIPHQAFMVFQMMFAIITPALITGAFAERAKFSTFLLFMVAWSLLVYAPIAHWVWAPGGWLRDLGALDLRAERWCT
jgi:Amt family ammonium transporter